MRRHLTLFILIFSCFVAWGQGAVVSGRIFDSESKEGIVGAIVEVQSLRDTLFRRHCTTGYGGHFKTSPLPRGSYKLTSTFLGYKSYERTIKVDALPINLNAIPMMVEAISIGAVVKEVVLPRATIVGDTLKYTASQFKVTMDAELESLLRKLPGISINNGRIEAQGEVVRAIYVDNKEFFGGNVQQVLQSIPAQAVESIEVYNRMSEASQITGVDDGEGGKVINIITRGSLSHSEFGKMHAGVGYGTTHNPSGTDLATLQPKMQSNGAFRYTVGGSINVFRDEMRMTLLALANNINKQNLSDDGIAMSNSTNSSNASRSFSVNRQSGVAAAEIVAFNYSDRWGKRKRTKFEGSLFYNHLNSPNHFTVDRWYNAPAKIDTFHYDQFSCPNNRTFRIDARIDTKVAKRQTLMLRPRYTFTRNTSVNANDSTSMRWGASGERYYPSGNDGGSRNHNASLYAQYSYKFLKHGRVFLLVANASHNNSRDARDYFSASYTPAMADKGNFGESFSHRTAYNTTTTLRLQPTFRERIGRHVTLNASYNVQYQDRHREQYYFATDDTFVVEDYDKFKRNSSMAYDGTYLFHEASLGVRYGKHRNWFSVNLRYRHSDLMTKNLWTDKEYRSKYNHFLYNATLNYAFKRAHSLRISANSKIQMPGLWVLNDVFNISSTTYMSVGNSNLRPSQEHNAFVRYTNVSARFGTTFMVMAKATHITDYQGMKIAYSPVKVVITDPDIATKPKTYSPVQISQRVNLDGYWAYEGRVSLGKPLKSLRSNLNLVAGATYSTIPAELVEGDGLQLVDTVGFTARGTSVMMNNTNVYAQATLGSNISENIDFTVTWRGNYSYNKSTLAVLENKYFMQYVRGNLKAVLPLTFTLSTSLTFTHYKSFTNSFEDHFTLWNISVGKKVLNGLGEVELCVNDVLDQNSSFGRGVWASYSQLRYNSVLGRTFLVRFTYNLRSLRGQRTRSRSFKFPQDPLGDVQSKLNSLRF